MPWVKGKIETTWRNSFSPFHSPLRKSNQKSQKQGPSLTPDNSSPYRDHSTKVLFRWRTDCSKIILTRVIGHVCAVSRSPGAKCPNGGDVIRKTISALVFGAVLMAPSLDARASNCTVSAGQILTPASGSACDFQLTQINNSFLNGIAITGRIDNTNGTNTTLTFWVSNDPLTDPVLGLDKIGFDPPGGNGKGNGNGGNNGGGNGNSGNSVNGGNVGTGNGSNGGGNGGNTNSGNGANAGGSTGGNANAGDGGNPGNNSDSGNGGNAGGAGSGASDNGANAGGGNGDGNANSGNNGNAGIGSSNGHDDSSNGNGVSAGGGNSGNDGGNGNGVNDGNGGVNAGRGGNGSGGNAGGGNSGNDGNVGIGNGSNGGGDAGNASFGNGGSIGSSGHNDSSNGNGVSAGGGNGGNGGGNGGGPNQVVVDTKGGLPLTDYISTTSANFDGHEFDIVSPIDMGGFGKFNLVAHDPGGDHGTSSSDKISFELNGLITEFPLNSSLNQFAIHVRFDHCSGFVGGLAGPDSTSISSDAGGCHRLPPPPKTPEPASLVLFGTGLLGLSRVVRRRLRSKK